MNQTKFERLALLSGQFASKSIAALRRQGFDRRATACAPGKKAVFRAQVQKPAPE
jgi:hypothetical protein